MIRIIDKTDYTNNRAIDQMNFILGCQGIFVWSDVLLKCKRLTSVAGNSRQFPAGGALAPRLSFRAALSRLIGQHLLQIRQLFRAA